MCYPPACTTPRFAVSAARPAAACCQPDPAAPGAAALHMQKRRCLQAHSWGHTVLHRSYQEAAYNRCIVRLFFLRLYKKCTQVRPPDLLGWPALHLTVRAAEAPAAAAPGSRSQRLRPTTYCPDAPAYRVWVAGFTGQQRMQSSRQHVVVLRADDCSASQPAAGGHTLAHRCNVQLVVSSVRRVATGGLAAHQRQLVVEAVQQHLQRGHAQAGEFQHNDAR